MNINKQTLLGWIRMDNEREKEKSANQWLPYLVDSNAASIWEQLLNETEFGSDKEHIQKSWKLVQTKAVARLFTFTNVDDMEAWFDYASYFLLSLQAVKISFEIQPFTSNHLKVCSYFLWVERFNKVIKENVRKEEFVEASIRCCEEILKILKPGSFPKTRALILGRLGLTYSIRIKGDKAENWEKAIDAFEAALLEFTHLKLLYDCASVQNNLGHAYTWRIKGNRAENIEKAIEVLQAALLERERGRSPFDWAGTKLNLGNAYSDRIKGDKRENLEKAISAYEESVLEFTYEKMPYDWARSQNCLGSAYSERINGDKAENVEKALAAYEAALLIYTQEKLPYEWAMTQLNLGNAYRQRIKGDKKENLEKAIAACEAALLEYARVNLPYEWAKAQNSLGVCYSNRINGDKAENVEKAIEAFKAALRERTREKLPYDWAETQNNLGIAYEERIKGDKKENLEMAIAACETALLEYTRDKLPHQWAKIQNNLGVFYRERIKGDKAENLEKAITACEAALLERTREKLPFEWALTQLNLAGAYIERIKGNKEENLEKGIAAFEAALLEYTPEKFFYIWAKIQSSLGTTYVQRIKGDKAENLEKAIEACEAALLERKHEKLPYDWAMTQINLGAAYMKRINGDKDKNIEKAISAFEAASLEFTEKLPYNWAMIQDYLGAAYIKRINGDETKNIEKAITSYTKALEIRLPQTLPHECLQTAHNLGVLLYGINSHAQAINALKTAHQALESMRNEIVASSSKERIVANYPHLYAILVDCLLHRVDNYVNQMAYYEAFEYVCAAKSRSLAEKLGSQRPDISILMRDNPALTVAWNEIETIWQQIEEIRMKLTEQFAGEIQNNIDINSLEPVRKNFSERLNDLLATRKNKLEDFSYQFPMLAATLTLPPVTVSAAQKLAAGLHCTIIEFYRHQGGWVVFVITGNNLKYISLPEEANESILDAVDLIQSFGSGLPAVFGSVLQKTFFQALYKNLFAPLKGFLPVNGSLLIAPYDLIHYVPLSLAQDANEEFLFEQYELRFISGTSSANGLYQQILKDDRIEQIKTKDLLMVVHSGTAKNKLNFTKTEMEAVVSVLKNNTLLLEERATPKAVIESAQQNVFSALHFNCHGVFDTESPELSGLMLQSTLTVEKILNELRIKNRPLVVMSACQTGRSKVGVGDELTGLNQALLQSGAGSIVSSLWSVNDEATMHLMKIFYEERMKTGISDTIALRKAMQIVKNMPGYKSSFFWGAFQVYGLPMTHR